MSLSQRAAATAVRALAGAASIAAKRAHAPAARAMSVLAAFPYDAPDGDKAVRIVRSQRAAEALVKRE
jgi:hypothetical protein